jgi:Uma2 family endonuclease
MALPEVKIQDWTTEEETGVHRWTREEYDQMAEAKVFAPEKRVELVDGVIYDMSPQKSRHATLVWAISEALRSILQAGSFIRIQVPLALSEDSEPEPDVAVVAGSGWDYFDHHPSSALLIVEVADSSLHHDRERKRFLYARAGIPECWIANLVKNQLEVYRKPVRGAYSSKKVLQAGDSVSPLFCPDASVAVADLLPRT